MSNNLGMAVVVGFIAFFSGWLLAKIAGFFAARSTAGRAPDEHRQIRSLEASLRVAQKKVHDIAEQFESTCVDLNALREEHGQLESELQSREAELDAARQAARDETEKVRELRRALTDRAEAKIRAEAHAKDVETELSVMQAGSDAMQDELHQVRDDARGASTASGANERDAEGGRRGDPGFLSDC